MAQLLGSDCARECSRDSRLDLRHGADSGGLHRVRRASGACIRRRSATDRAALLHEFGIAEVGEANLESRPRPTWRCVGPIPAALHLGYCGNVMAVHWPNLRLSLSILLPRLFLKRDSINHHPSNFLPQSATQHFSAGIALPLNDRRSQSAREAKQTAFDPRAAETTVGCAFAGTFRSDWRGRGQFA